MNDYQVITLDNVKDNKIAKNLSLDNSITFAFAYLTDKFAKDLLLDKKVIIKKIKNNKIYLIDPLLGDKCILLKDFEKKWSKKVLLVEKVKKTKCQDYIKFSKYYSSKQIILYFVEIVVLFLVAFLTKYNQDSSPFLICLFVILMFVINQFKI